MAIANLIPFENTSAAAATSNDGNFSSLQFLKRVLARWFASKTAATGTISASGDNLVIASPGAGNRLVICAERWQLEEDAAITVVLKGAAAIQRVRCADDGAGFDRTYPAGQEIRLSENQAYVGNLSEAKAVGYSVQYFVEVVSTGLPL